MPFRLLEPVPDLSCGEADSGNLIVQGDNLHALKALLPHNTRFDSDAKSNHHHHPEFGPSGHSKLVDDVFSAAASSVRFLKR